MKKIIIGITISLITVISLLIFPDGVRTQELSGIDFVETYEKTNGAVLLDVRTPSEFAAGHMDEAINIDFESPTFTTEVGLLDKTKPYFVYCRSGNRSGQAIAIMQKEGFKNIFELQGGINSNKDALKLVTTTPIDASAYVVDASDMVDGNALTTGITSSVLNEKEIKGLLRMREEEKLARDVYTTLGAKWGTRIFANIASSEQTHTDAIKVLLDKYSIVDPTTDDTVGVFHSPLMQKLYDDLTARGLQSSTEALTVGALIEDLDIYDLDILMKETDKEDILSVYSNLQRGSRNHMRAFIKNLSMSGGVYAPQYISNEAFTAIINASQERGRGKF
jgi:rhodanese-related sulfurtransferase